MVNIQQYIGASVVAYVPDDARLIALGYSHVRIFWASSEAGTYTQVASLPLVSGQRDYFFNHTTASLTDWWYWAPWGAVPGLGPASEPMPVGPPRHTRREIRQAVGRRLRLLDLATITAAASATAVTCAALADADASPAKYANRFARAASGNVEGQTVRVRSSAQNGYAPASGALTFGNAFTLTPTVGTILELWKPAQDNDPSVLIDEAMQRARRMLWWEETWFLTVDADVTEYAAPTTLIPGTIKAVDYAAGTYPQRPGWSPVGYWDLSMDLGQPLLSIRQSAIWGSSAYSQGTIVRVLYNTIGDRMDNDGDFWGVPLEWAVPEVAFEYLSTVITPGGGKEDVSDAHTARARVMEEALGWRRLYMPRAKVAVRLPQ